MDLADNDFRPDGSRTFFFETCRLLGYGLAALLFVAGVAALGAAFSYTAPAAFGTPLCVSLAGVFALTGHSTIIWTEKRGYRATHLRWQVLPAAIVHRQSPHTIWFSRLIAPELVLLFGGTTGMFLPNWWELQIGGFAVLVISVLGFVGALCLGVLQLLNIRKLWNYRAEISMTAAGLRVPGSVFKNVRAIPWSRIQSLRFVIQELRYNNRLYHLAIRVEEPEMYGLKPAKLNFVVRKGEVLVPLSPYLETPRNIFADAAAFYARYGGATADATYDAFVRLV